MDANGNGVATENNWDDFDKNNKKNLFVKFQNFLHVHDLFKLEIGNKEKHPKKISREIEGDGVTFDDNGNVSSCTANFHSREETEY